MRVGRKKIRITYSLMFVFLVFAIITGCKRNENPKSSLSQSAAKKTQTSGNRTSTAKSTQKSSATNVTTNNNKSEVKENQENDANDGESDGDYPDEKIIDMDGKSIVIATFNVNWFPPQDEETASGDVLQYIKWKSMKDIESKYNCKLDFKLAASAAIFNTELVNNFMAGSFYCDAYITQPYTAFPRYYNQKIMLCWEDLYDLNSDSLWAEYPEIGIGTWRNKIWGLKSNPASGGPGMSVWYNKNILASAGLPDLWEYVDAGNWNWSVFTDICQTITRDFNGDGIVDQWGIAAKPNNLAGVLIASNGGTIVDFTSGNAVYAMDDVRNIRALQYMSDLYNTYKVITSEANLSTKNSFNEFPLGTIGMFYYGGAYGENCVRKGVEPSSLGYVYPPMGPDANDYRMYDTGAGQVVFLNPKTLYAEDVAIVLQDYLCVWDPAEEYCLDMHAFMEDTAKKWTYDDRSQAFFAVGGYKNAPLYDLHYTLGTVLNNGLYNQIILQSVSVTGGLDAVRQKAISLIDSLENPE